MEYRGAYVAEQAARDPVAIQLKAAVAQDDRPGDAVALDLE